MNIKHNKHIYFLTKLVMKMNASQAPLWFWRSDSGGRKLIRAAAHLCTSSAGVDGCGALQLTHACSSCLSSSAAPPVEESLQKGSLLES